MSSEALSVFCERINELFDRFKSRPGLRGTNKEFQMHLGVSEGQLKGWLQGKSEPNIETLKKIARIENVSVSWLIGEEKPPKDNSPASVLAAKISRADAQTLAQLEQFYNYLEYHKKVQDSPVSNEATK